MTEPKPLTARARVRAELTAEITQTARRHVVENGPQQLSLRAVARELGMVSSALYRYFPSRDALITQLIIDAYNAMGDRCDEALEHVAPDDLAGRFRAVGNAVRSWSIDNRHEYALIYGTPVPGYAAPTDTVDPASRVIRHLVDIAIALDNADAPLPIEVVVSGPLHQQILDLIDANDRVVNEQRFLTAANAWALIFGMVSFEVFGRFNGMFDDTDGLFAHQLERAGRAMGMTF